MIHNRPILVVTEPALNAEIFKRWWTPPLYALYLKFYRWSLLSGIKDRLANFTGEVYLLTSAEIIPTSFSHPRVKVLYYDVEAGRVNLKDIPVENDRFLNDWFQTGNAMDSRWLHRGISLPDVMKVQMGIFLHLEVTWFIGTLKLIMKECNPSGVILATGASIPERIAQSLSKIRGFEADRIFVNHLSYVIPKLWAWLLRRGEKRKWISLRDQPRQERAVRARNKLPTILTIACVPRHLNTLKPLLDAFSHRSDVHVQLLAMTRMGSHFHQELSRMENSVISTSYCMDFLPREEAELLINQSGDRFRSLWADLLQSSRARTERYHGGMDLFSLALDVLKMTSLESSLVALLHIEAIYRCMEANVPSGVLAINDRRYPERAAVLMAKSRGIPASFYLNWPILSRDMTNKFDIADSVMVVGENFRKSLIGIGHNSAAISLVGDPRFDQALSAEQAGFRQKFCAQYGLEVDKPIVLMASKYTSTNFTIAEKKNFYEIMQGAFSQMPSFQWVVKAHPNEDIKQLHKQIEKWGMKPRAIVQSTDITLLLKAADISIMVTSLSGLESMILEVPVIAVQPDQKDFDTSNIVPYIKSEVVRRVRNVDELSAAMRELVQDSPARQQQVERAFEFAGNYLSPPDGKAAERILSGLGWDAEENHSAGFQKLVHL